MRNAYQSLSSANPTATSLSIDLASLQAAAGPTPTSSTTSTAMTEEPTTTGDSDSNSSGGASQAWIAGAVIGGVAGVALIVGIVWFILRQRKKKAAQPAAMASDHNPASTDEHKDVGIAGFHNGNHAADKHPAFAEVEGDGTAKEMPTDRPVGELYSEPVELPASDPPR